MQVRIQDRHRDRCSWLGRLRGLVLLALFFLSVRAWAEAPATAMRAFEQYAANVEAALAQRNWAISDFNASAGTRQERDARLERGELIIEHLTPAGAANPPGALLHHWRGTAFVAGATAADFERLKDFNAYPQLFSPQVVRARILSSYSGGVPDHFTAVMRVRQKHLITVVMDTTYDVGFGRVDARHGYSISRSTKIAEIDSPDTPKERALSDAEEHGFLWRLNTYWRYEERDGGLYLQIESISLTRAIPAGLGWALRPYVESVPRESLEFTLLSTCNALKSNRLENGR
jgi:hypothetical protein